MKAITISLSGIYKASQCADINDVNFAISALKNIYWFTLNGTHTPATRRRMTSLQNRKKQLSK